MAELETACCGPEAQASCCGPEAKSECCGPQHGSGCGCAAAATDEGASTATTTLVRDAVRDKYAAAAKAAAAGADASCRTDAHDTAVFGSALYAGTEQVPESVSASLGCGVPTAVADLHEGETVLDLGSGAGADVLISARRVGNSGRAIGLDMTDEMLALAESNAAQAGVRNVQFLKGYMEEIPLADGSVDVVISNCVINLSGDKPAVIREAARVLRPGGRLAVSDVLADEDMDEATRADMEAWTGCIAGALTRQQFDAALRQAGLEGVEIRETHRVHQHASAAIIRARKPNPTDSHACVPLIGWPDSHQYARPVSRRER